jgi:protocatechuate 3,4-dioxygenase beta subunit
MTKNIRLGLGLAVLLILGFWGWQSTNHLKSQPEKTEPKVLEVTPRRMETPVDPPPLSSSDLNQRAGEKPGTVSGTVRVKSTGEPVPGTLIQVTSDALPFENDLVRHLRSLSARADKKGNYTLTGIPPNIELYLKASSPSADLYIDNGDLPVFTLSPGEKKTGVNINLTQGQAGVLSGTVVGRTISFQTVDNPTTQTTWGDHEKLEEIALPGVKITLMDESQKEELQRTETDQSGCFRFEKIQPSRYFVRAELPEGAAFVPDNHPSRSRFVDFLKNPTQESIPFYFRMDGVSIEGRVTDSKGSPLVGATITAFHAARPTDLNRSLNLSEKKYKTNFVLSNEKGQFRINNLPVSSLGDGGQYLRKEEYNWEFHLECEATGYCMSRLVVPPFPDSIIKAVLMCDEEDLKRAPTEAMVQYLKYADVKLPSGQGNVITGVDFVLSSAGSISGRVVDSRHENFRTPAEEAYGAWISLVPEAATQKKKAGDSNSKPIPVPEPVMLAEASSFRFEAVPAGRYFFNVLTFGPQSTQMTIRAKNPVLTLQEGEAIQDLEVVVESSADRGNLTGHVVDALTGQPVDSLSVKVLRVDSPNDDSNPQRGFIQTENLPAGDFSITQVSAGKATLELSVPGYATVQADVVVSSGQTTEQTFQIGGGGTLSGQVVDSETKQPVEAFEVKVAQGDGKPIEGFVKKDEAKKGTFLLSGLPAGRIVVTISQVPGCTEMSEEVEIVAGKTTEQTFLIQRKGSLAGRIEFEGKGAGYAYLDARKVESKDAKSINHQAQANEQGEYRMKELDPGNYIVMARSSYNGGFQGKTQVEIYNRAEVKIETGKETHQDFIYPEGTATLKCLFKASDRNLHWRIEILRGSVSSLVSTDYLSNESLIAGAWNLQEGGYCEVRSLPAGSYTVFARCYENLSGKVVVASEKSQTVTLTDGQSLTVNFDLP